jgi:CheY-like chemotaxis protein
VEDSELNLRIAKTFLTRIGLEVSVARNGQEALDTALREDFDLILMDVQMPVMDGLTATRRLRELPKTRSLQIVAMTASALPFDIEACLAAGMNVHLAKPIYPEHLTRTLKDLLQRPGESEPPGPEPIPRQAPPASEPLSARPAPPAPFIAGIDPEQVALLYGGDLGFFRQLLEMFTAEFDTA